jgi:mycothiol maleylpyruvate isomerase-like protein
VASKQELIGGLEFLIQEGKRIGGAFDDAAWAKVQDGDGWKNKQVLAHVAGIGTVVVPFVQNMASADATADAGAGLDINALNAGLVGARADKSVPELVDELAANYRGVIDFVKGQTDDFWTQKRNFGGYTEVPVSDLLMRLVVLHGIGHIDSAYAAAM